MRTAAVARRMSPSSFGEARTLASPSTCRTHAGAVEVRSQTSAREWREVVDLPTTATHPATRRTRMRRIGAGGEGSCLDLAVPTSDGSSRVDRKLISILEGTRGC